MTNPKEVRAWEWTCPYCKHSDIDIDHGMARIALNEHIADCFYNPALKHCRSCHYNSGQKCTKYNTGWLTAKYTHEGDDYTCTGWEVKPHLAKIQEKLRGDK